MEIMLNYLLSYISLAKSMTCVGWQEYFYLIKKILISFIYLEHRQVTNKYIENKNKIGQGTVLIYKPIKNNARHLIGILIQ